MNSKTIEELKFMSLNPISSRLIGQDFTCIGGLVLLISTADENIILDILEIFHNLIVNDTNKQYLKEFIGVKQQLEYLEEKFLTGTIIHLSASTLKRKLFKPDINRLTSIIKRDRKFNESFIIKNCRNYFIELKGLKDMETVEEMKKSLVNLDGVLSIKFQLQKKLVVVKASVTLPLDDIVAVLLNTTKPISVEVIGSSKALMEENVASFSRDSKSGYFQEPICSNDNENMNVPVINVSSSKTRFGSLIHRVTKVFNDYFW